MTRASPSSEIPSPSLAKRFVVVTLFAGGEGWSAAVRARGEDGAASAVLKILDSGAPPTEVSLLTSIDHPCVPRVLDVGDAGDGQWFVLREFVDGETLSVEAAWAPDRVVELAVELLQTLAAVHARGVLHLDIKPANVLASRGADGSMAYTLLDFGLGSRRVEGGVVVRGGTPFYAAPEVLLGLPTDERADLFGVGALLLQLLAPRRRIRRDHDAILLERGLLAAIGLNPKDLPPPFDQVVPRLVARQPDARYLDAHEALEAVAGHSGRPALSSLNPDPIALHGAALAAALATAGHARPLVIRGGDPTTRHALALHAATLRPSVNLVDGVDHTTVTPPDAEPESALQFEVPAADAAAVADHLHSALDVDPPVARAIAEHWISLGVTTAGALALQLQHLVDEAAIVPDGPRWIWPDAVAGRLPDLSAPPEWPTGPDGIRRHAARGALELAVRAYRDLAAKTPDRERELRAALASGLLQNGQPVRALPFVADLPLLRAWALVDRGRADDAQRVLRELTDADPTSVLRLTAAVDLLQGRAREARARLEAVPAGDLDAAAQLTLAKAQLDAGDRDAAGARFGTIVAETDAVDQPYLLAVALTGLAETARLCGDLAEARGAYERAHELFRGLGHVRHCATSLTNLGVLAKDERDYAAAIHHQRQARALYEHVGDQRGVALATANYGIASLEHGDPASARARLEEALALFDALGSGGPRSLVLFHLARAHQGLGEFDAANARLEEAGELPAALSDDVARLRDRLASGHAESEVETAPAARTRHDGAMLNDSISKDTFRTFLAVNRRLAGEADLDRAMEYLVEAAVTLTGGRAGHLLVSRGDGLRREFRAGDAEGSSLAFSRSMVNRAVQERRICTAEDAMEDRDLRDMPSVQNLRHRSAVCVPFSSAGGNEGAIYVEHAGRAGVFGATEKEYLEILADQAAIAVDRMLHEEALATDLEKSQRELAVARRTRRAPSPKMIGSSPAMREMQSQIDRVAASDLAVLVRGETGSGKELVARAIHDRSGRTRGPFIAENCSAIPEQLMESELFGSVKGAFTGAAEDRAGLLELASGGTLFLDEIGDMPPALQTKLLRALQEKSIRRVGGTETLSIDIRLVSATHKDLLAMTKDGSFREDLYFRIVAVEVRVPPLRERGEDVLALAEAFLAELCREHNRSVSLDAARRAELEGYDWPGNVRELHHVMSRAFILSDGDRLGPLQLPERSVDAPGADPEAAREPRAVATWPVLTLQEAEQRTIEAALESTGGDKTAAAKVLGISRTALYEKLKRIQARDA